MDDMYTWRPHVTGGWGAGEGMGCGMCGCMGEGGRGKRRKVINISI